MPFFSTCRIFVCDEGFKNKRGSGGATDCCSNCAYNSLHHSSLQLFMNACLIFSPCVYSKLDILSNGFSIFFTVASLSCSSLVLVHLSKLCVKIYCKMLKEKGSEREKIESEIVGVIDKNCWQRSVDKKGMEK